MWKGKEKQIGTLAKTDAKIYALGKSYTPFKPDEE